MDVLNEDHLYQYNTKWPPTTVEVNWTDDPPPQKEWDYWDYFNRHCENMARWLRLWRVL